VLSSVFPDLKVIDSRKFDVEDVYRVVTRTLEQYCESAAEVDCRSKTSRNLDKCVIASRGSEVQTSLDILPLKKRIVCEDFIP
jgi:hypothetical protein